MITMINIGWSPQAGEVCSFAPEFPIYTFGILYHRNAICNLGKCLKLSNRFTTC